MKITIDDNSGFCFGVQYAIEMAEDVLNNDEKLYCLGDIVHNEVEVKRLADMGLQSISHEEFVNLKNCKVLIRAHGEPPSTYQLAMQNNIELIDASCPVVLKLQNRLKNSYDKIETKKGQLVIFGLPGHAEVRGLDGQTNGNSILITTDEDLDKIDYKLPIALFSQTTKSTQAFYAMGEKIRERAALVGNSDIQFNDTICRQVSNRDIQLQKFATEHTIILFVSGKKSSNGKVLFNVCKNINTRSYFVSDTSEIDLNWLKETDSVGICGATSTPLWLMQKVALFLAPTVSAIA